MRLLLLCTEFPPGPGGIATHAHQLAVHLARLGWDVSVLTRQDYAEPAEIANFNRDLPFPVVSIRRFPTAPVKALAAWYMVSRFIRRWRPDLLVASGERFLYLAAALACVHRLPWAAIEHGRTAVSWELLLKRWSLTRANAVVCVSRYTRSRLLALGVRSRAGQVILNGADPGVFRRLGPDQVQETRAALGLNGARLLITVGHVSHRKGQDVVIRAMPRILQQAPDTHYLIAGIPTRQPEYASLAQSLGVAERVHFLGRVDRARLVGLLNSSDVFVMTSRHATAQFEGYGIAVAEAALCGLPAVVSSGSGLAEAIVERETGLTVPADDEAATAEAVLALLNDPMRRRAMGEAARRRALDGQTWEQRAREYDRLFRSLI